ncbi:GDSL-type esterase/lipase family protein [Echinicola sp. 20G]|uniref:GDSL-type esterase/lipase family protein n=1 Tax=Echinicola sp. 20G TaxID=2781961 RepID=UPI001910A359|nr:GDSL-type esterase/lipase family protein [Echinicola sp. 20G]
MKNGQQYPRHTLLIICLLFLIIGCGSFKKQTGDLVLYPTEKVVTKYHNEWTVGHYQKRIKAFQENPLNFGDIVFVGNSITEQGKDWSEKFNLLNIRNRGISGDVTDGVLARLEEIVHYTPKAVFLLIGINDLSNYHQENEPRPNVVYHSKIPSPEYIAKNIIKIAITIQKRTPKTQVFVQTILPNAKPEMKESIDLINQIVKENESKYEYRIIDLNRYFIDQEGLMKKNLTNDGTHLNEQGYAVWVEAEKSIVNGL